MKKQTLTTLSTLSSTTKWPPQAHHWHNQKTKQKKREITSNDGGGRGMPHPLPKIPRDWSYGNIYILYFCFNRTREILSKTMRRHI